MELENRRWEWLRAGLESDLRKVADRRSALREFGVDAAELESRALKLRRDRVEEGPMGENDTKYGNHPTQVGSAIPITEVRVTPKDQGRLRALCSVTFAGVFVVRGIKVIEGPDRLFLAMPSRREVDGKYRDVCHPVANGFREELERCVLEEYARKVGVMAPSSRDGRPH